jgi:hypothetical protein
MKSYPLESISLEQAEEKQFFLVKQIMFEFHGNESINLGDLGCVQPLNKPETTAKVEKVLARFFGAEACALVTGSGTGAIRCGMMAAFSPGSTILVHNAPIYPTSEVSIKGLGLKIVRADFNDSKEIHNAFLSHNIDEVLIQHTRQVPQDRYSLGEVIEQIKKEKQIPILVDDNYAVMKVSKIGVQFGADFSAFSAFKLLGPEGVGVLLGKKNYIDIVNQMNYSGGSKVQGWQAMEVLRGMVYAPVALAVQAEQAEKLVNLIKDGKNPHIKDAFIANSQSKVVLVEFSEDIAEKVLKFAERMGALPNPVGAESKYELAPMFYRVSGTYLKDDPSLIHRMIRINPNRAGAETIYSLLNDCIQKAKERI